MSKSVFNRTLKSSLAEVDAHLIQPGEYDELPELTDAMLACAVAVNVNQGLCPPQPVKSNPAGEP